MIEFWERYPALLIGLFIFLGATLALQREYSTLWLFLIPLVALFLQPHRALFLASALGIAAFFYTHSSCTLPLQTGMQRGTAVAEIVDVKEELKHGKPHTRIRLHIERFHHENGELIAKNIQASLTWKGRGARPQAGYLYELQAALNKSDEGWISLYPGKEPWQILEKRPSLTEWRLTLKKRLTSFFEKVLPQGSARTFLQGLFLGEFHDPLLGDNLRRFGLSHIMVVSGFHFSLIVAFLAFLLRFTLPWKASCLGLVMGATFYLLFIGPTASVMRAWISVGVLFSGKFFERRATGLNSLGVALIAQLIYEPTWCLNLGFQLSFLATFAILLFYSPIDGFLSGFLKDRTYSVALELSLFDQITYMLLIFFRKSLALSFAVNLLMLPMSLFYFQQFPILSMLYNLFFPVVTSLCLFLLCLSLLVSWVPVLSTGLFWLTYKITCLLLTPVNFLPRSFDINITVQDMPVGVLVAILTGTIAGGIILHSRSKEQESSLFRYV